MNKHIICCVSAFIKLLFFIGIAISITFINLSEIYQLTNFTSNARLDISLSAFVLNFKQHISILYISITSLTNICSVTHRNGYGVPTNRRRTQCILHYPMTTVWEFFKSICLVSNQVSVQSVFFIILLWNEFLKNR